MAEEDVIVCVTFSAYIVSSKWAARAFQSDEVTGFVPNSYSISACKPRT